MNTPATRRWFTGWPLTWMLVCLVFAAAGAVAWTTAGSEGARAAIRLTARTSLLLFLLAFSASTMQQLWPSRITRWSLVNRRYLGVAFVGSHLVHALAIVVYAQLDPVRFYASQNAIAYTVNGIGYGFILAMGLTSLDRTRAWIGAGAWRWLHLVGSYYIWFGFAKSYFPRAIASAFYLPFALLLLVALGLRIWAWRRRRALSMPRNAEV